MLLLTKTSHFLGGSFTYQQIKRIITPKQSKSVLVELRFHVSNHFFLCTSQQVNEHFNVYLTGDVPRFDQTTNAYQENRSASLRANQRSYDIQCASEAKNSACDSFKQEVWGHCESANPISGYSILKRQFSLIADRFKPLYLHYVRRCELHDSILVLVSVRLLLGRCFTQTLLLPSLG